MWGRRPLVVNPDLSDGPAIATHPAKERQVNNIAGLSWWVVGILIAIVAIALILVTR